MIRESLSNGQIRVTLDNDDATTAGTIAIAYGLDMLHNPGWRPDRGFQGNFWEITRNGLIAEYAVALGMGFTWDPSPPGTHDSRDIAGVYQVKYTIHDRGALMLSYQKVEMDAIYILVTGGMPVYLIRGWIKGVAAKDERYLWKPREDRPAQLFIPQDRLLRMDLIPQPGEGLLV